MASWNRLVQCLRLQARLQGDVDVPLPSFFNSFIGYNSTNIVNKQLGEKKYMKR